MRDDNLTSSLSTLDRRELLEDPRVTAAAHHDIINQLRAQLDEALGK